MEPASLREGNILTTAETATVQGFLPLSHPVFGRHVEMGMETKMLSGKSNLSHKDKRTEL